MIVWLLAFAIYPQVVDSSAAQILLMVNTTVVMGAYFYTAFNIRNLKRRSARMRLEEEGEKAALEVVSGKKRLIEIAGKSKSIIKEVEVKQKSDLSIIEARLKFITDFLRNLVPGAIAFAALFEIPFAKRIISLLGAAATLIILTVDVLSQPRIIEKKECIAMLEQAQTETDEDLSPPKESAETVVKEQSEKNP